MNKEKTRLNLTYLALRRNLGILGITLPLVLYIGNGLKVEPSISQYYYTDMMVVFTGILIAFGLFLFSYKGPERTTEVINDDWLTNVAGLLAIITALVPTACSGCLDVPNGHNNHIIGLVHLVSAAGFFLIMGWISFFRFTKGEYDKVDLKAKRKPIYYTCGVIIWACIILLFIDIKFDLNYTGKDIFIGETVALVFFGIAWFIKGEALKKFNI